MQLTDVVPFLLEDELKRLGGRYEKAADWADFTVVDGRLITGQNPSSSTSAAKALLKFCSSRFRRRLVRRLHFLRGQEVLRDLLLHFDTYPLGRGHKPDTSLWSLAARVERGHAE